MHCSTFLASVAAFAVGTTSAAAVANGPGDDTIRYAQLRLYGEGGCHNQNLGELGIYGTAINTCQTFPGGDVIRSVRFEHNYRACQLHVYSDLQCHLGRHDVAEGECLSGDKQYRSYKTDCSP